VKMEFTLKVQGTMFRAGEEVRMDHGETLMSMCEDGDGTFLAMSTIPGTTLVGLVVLPLGAVFSVQGLPVNLETITNTDTQPRCSVCGLPRAECSGHLVVNRMTGAAAPDTTEDDNDDEDDDDDNEEPEGCPYCDSDRHTCSCEDRCGGGCGHIEAECSCEHDSEEEEVPDEERGRVDPPTLGNTDESPATDPNRCDDCAEKAACGSVKLREPDPSGDFCVVCNKLRSQCLCT
jgi:hypothetical protein